MNTGNQTPQPKDLSHIDIPLLEKFVNDSQTISDSATADTNIQIFLDNYRDWREVVGYLPAGKDGEELYGRALCAYSHCLFEASAISKGNANLLRDEVLQYERQVKYYYPFKDALYYNLALCLNKSGLGDKKEIKEYLKKAIYYSVAQTNHTSYAVECFAYRSTSDYMLESLRTETLSMSPPTSFNDPFDCPIIELLSLYGDNFSKLVREVYTECLKVTCFVNNLKLERKSEGANTSIRERKHLNDPEEYLHELMWAHYADNHKGICVKYHFRNDITKFVDETKSQIAYFRDIEYTSDMSKYGNQGSINLKDAFFAKGKAWEYENELRLLAFDPNGNGEYGKIDAKNSVSAIYFGLKCPPEKQDEIMGILKGRKWVSELHRWDDTVKSVVPVITEHPIEYYRMELDENHFGKLKAVKIGESA